MRAWARTYGIYYKITCSANNYGPFQNDEKFIPTIIRSLIFGKKVPVYGNGKQKRNWIFVKDNAEAIIQVVLKAKNNSTYNIGTQNDFTNIFLVKKICEILIDNFGFNKNIINQIRFVKDRPGHDIKYKINSNKIRKELKWKPEYSFEKSIFQTVVWYLNKYNK